MKKFLTAILFLMLVTVGYAQCINVEITPIKGNCYTDNQIKVTAKDMSPFPSICLPSSGKFTVQIKGDGVNQMVRMTPNPVPTPGATAEHTFYNMKMGKYTITVRDEVTGAFEENEVEVESNYKLMNITNIEALAPTCDRPNTGGVKFRIPNGGIGPFEVTVLDMNRNVIIPMQVFNRPTGYNYIEVRGDDSHPLPKSKVFILEVKDQTNIGPQCGHTLRFPSLEIPSQNKYVVGCINIKTYRRHYTKSDQNCGKFSFYVELVRPEDNQWIYYNIEDWTSFRDFFKRPGTAVVRFLNSSKPAIDMSSTFNDYGYRIDNYVFEKGDEIEMTIKGPKNTIVERYKINNEFNIPSGRICNSIFTSARNNSYNYSSWRELSCGTYTLTTNKYLSGYYDTPSTQYPYVNDLNNGQSLQIEVGGWANGYSNLTLQRKVGGGTWVDESTPTVSGATYRYIYKTVPPGCPSGVSCEFVIAYPPFTVPPMPSHNFSLEEIWKYVQIGYGMYENTGAFRINHHIANVYYPIKYTVMPADGTKTITYQAKIAFLDTFTRTVTFPIEYSSDNYNCGYQYSSYFNLTNLPAGNYIVVASTCGQTSTRTITLPGMPAYKPQLTYTKDCDVMKIVYNIGNQILQDPGIPVYLEKYQEDQWGNVYWQNVKSTSGHSGSFPNLRAGKYRVRTAGYYYNAYLPSNYAPLGTNNTSNLTRYDVCDPGLPTDSYGVYKSKEIDVEALKKLTPIINPIVCHQGATTGMIAVDVTGEEVFFPVTYYLNRLTSATDTGTGVTIASKTYQLSDNKYYHLFENVPNGNYKVIVSHRCEDVPQNFDLNLSAAFDPFLTIDRPVPFCRGNQARVGISVSENIFDIKWYKTDKDGNKLTSAPYKVGQSFWDTIYDTTYYLAEYSLKPGLGCTNNTIYTKTATVVMPPADEPPFAKRPCPSDITQTVDPGQCTKMIRWREPEYYPTCRGALTTTRSHAPGDMFPIGVTTVTYTFTDPNGNTSSCSFFITIKSNAVKLKKSHRYVDTSGNPITQVQVNQPFYYELKYENNGAETISKAVINVKLPDNTTLISNGAPDLSGAGDGTWNNPQPTSAYSAANKTWRFEIGANGTTSSLKAGDPQRVIRIPLKVEGNCNALFAPCENYLQTDLSFNYEGGPRGCPSAAIIEEDTLSTTVDTSGCDRQEIHCGTGAMTFNAIGGFTTYQWYDSNGAIVGANTASYSPINPGIYKVVKTISCHGVNLTVTETIDYISVGNIQDPIK
ncbi:HYR domain-containing protein, partial [Capnocytophaga leadbetteri]|uniref:HYR domain-containing protein n=1 Tax=Capnocytophaga leadbetteri TaxID=327575 RepID=UPI0028E230D9